MNQAILPYFTPLSEETTQMKDWIFQTILPYIKGRVFEMNSRQDLITDRLLENGFTLQLNSTSNEEREILMNRFKDNPSVRGIHKINFQNPRMEVKYLRFQAQFSSVLAISEIEKFEFYDKNALEKAKRLLVSGGHLIIVAPSPVDYYPGSPQDLEALKRFNKKHIKHLLTNCQILIITFFDWKGIWFIAIGRKI
jgi:hypothetical protein